MHLHFCQNHISLDLKALFNYLTASYRDLWSLTIDQIVAVVTRRKTTILFFSRLSILLGNVDSWPTKKMPAKISPASARISYADP